MDMQQVNLPVALKAVHPAAIALVHCHCCYAVLDQALRKREAPRACAYDKNVWHAHLVTVSRGPCAEVVIYGSHSVETIYSLRNEG